MTIDHFLNAGNRTNFENRENPEIAGNSVKNWPFSGLQNNKTQPFFMISALIDTYSLTSVLSHAYIVFVIQKMGNVGVELQVNITSTTI